MSKEQLDREYYDQMRKFGWSDAKIAQFDKRITYTKKTNPHRPKVKK